MSLIHFIIHLIQVLKHKEGRDSNSLRAGQAGNRIPVGGEIFRTRPDRPWGPHSPLYKG